MGDSPVAPIFEVVLSWPPRACQPNARVHYQAKGAAVAAYRFESKVLSLGARRLLESQRVLFPLRAPVRAVITFVVKDRTRRDFDNMLASIKAGIDGLRDAGVIFDDSCWVFKPTLDVVMGKKPGVRIRLEGYEGA